MDARSQLIQRTLRRRPIVHSLLNSQRLLGLAQCQFNLEAYVWFLIESQGATSKRIE